VKQFLHRTAKLLIQHRIAIFLWLIIAIVIFTNTFHEKYPDEFDNILGGQYLSEGQMLYRDYFTHHGPVPYFIAALLMPFSLGSFVLFRIAYATFLFFFFLFSYLFLRRVLDEKYARLYPLLVLAISVSSTYFWGHMLLADSFAAIVLLPAYFILLSHVYARRTLSRSMHLFLAISFGFALLSSMSYLFMILCIYIVIFCLVYRSPKQYLRHILIYLTPYLVFFILLLLTNSLSDWYRQTIQFNAQFYIYNYPRTPGSNFINPLRYAIVIAQNFFENIHPVLTNISRVDFFYPFNTALAYGNLLFFAILLYQRKYLLGFLLLSTLIFANARSNPLTSQERDYQAAMYITLSFTHTFFGLFVSQRLFSKLSDYFPKVILTIILVPTIILWFFNGLFITRKWFDRVYERYMGLTPLIYDRPQLAPIINATIKPNEYMWIGPFDFEDHFYARGLSPSKYHILLPGMAQNGMVEELQADLQRNKPKLIIYDWHLFILGNAPKDYAPQFLEYLDQNYIRLLEYREPDGTQYKSVAPIELRRDVEAKMYINPQYKDEVIADLLRANIIYRTAP
jgi:hypothetical protein